MKSLLKMAWMEFKLFLREPVAAFFTLVFPLMMLFLFGTIYGNKPADVFGGFGMVDISTPGYGAMIIGTTGLMSLPIALASYREFHILRRMRTTPVSPLTILMAHVIVMFIMVILGMALLVIAAKLVYNLRFAGSLPVVAAAFVLSTFSFLAIGFLLGGIMPNARTAQIVGMVLLYPMIFLSGATIPREFLPESVKAVANYLPLSPVVTLLEGLWKGLSWADFRMETLYLVAMLIVCGALAKFTFRWE